jgi:predicted nuclease of restriction endonuclease-like (RecB) superfamily
MSEITGNDYSEFLIEIKTRIRLGQYQALRAANKELLELYWDIGKSIHSKQESLGWGKSVVESLASDLKMEFPGKNEFSAQNLWLMRQFYTQYSENIKLQPLVREISWESGMAKSATSGCTNRREKVEYCCLNRFLTPQGGFGMTMGSNAEFGVTICVRRG